MNTIQLSENLIKLRHEKKLTQDDVAQFLGVTKASVSKWETKQSMPDILLLPQLANFFSVTLDELIGYQPQLSTEQIRALYQKLCNHFQTDSVADAFSELEHYTHLYYSCYPFLIQISILYLNHFNLLETKEEQTKALETALALCMRVQENSNSYKLISDAVSLQALIELSLGHPQQVIELLEPQSDPCQLRFQNETVLVQAYQMNGEPDKAKSYSQITLYLQLLSLIGSSTQYLALNIEQLELCENTMQRAESVAQVYDLIHLHPNIMAQLYYQEALVYSFHQKLENTIEKLNGYYHSITILFHNLPGLLHGDSYFNRIDSWINQLPLGNDAPRNHDLILQGAKNALNHPAFQWAKKTPEFQKLMEKVNKLSMNQ